MSIRFVNNFLKLKTHIVFLTQVCVAVCMLLGLPRPGFMKISLFILLHIPIYCFGGCRDLLASTNAQFDYSNKIFEDDALFRALFSQFGILFPFA